MRKSKFWKYCYFCPRMVHIRDTISPSNPSYTCPICHHPLYEMPDKRKRRKRRITKAMIPKLHSELSKLEQKRFEKRTKWSP